MNENEQKLKERAKTKFQENCAALNELSQTLHNSAVAKGFWEKPRNLGELLMLIVSELSEALEADRKDKYADRKRFERKGLIKNFQKSFEISIKDSFEDEIADVFIRLLDLCGALGIDIAFYIENKMRFNQLREYKHGKKY